MPAIDWSKNIYMYEQYKMECSLALTSPLAIHIFTAGFTCYLWYI